MTLTCKFCQNFIPDFNLDFKNNRARCGNCDARFKFNKNLNLETYQFPKTLERPKNAVFEIQRNSSPAISNFKLFFAALLPILFGLIFIIGGISECINAYESRNWP